MCSSLTLHPHNTYTMQHAERGGPCWDTVVNRYRDTQNPPRWILERPNDRGSIMPGPDAIPVPDWTATRIIGLESDACAPFTTSWIEKDGGAALDYDTWVEGASKLYQGKTVSNQPVGIPATAGVITILAPTTATRCGCPNRAAGSALPPAQPQLPVPALPARSRRERPRPGSRQSPWSGIPLPWKSRPGPKGMESR